MSRLVIALLVVALARPDSLMGQGSSPTASIVAGTRVRITQPGQKSRIGIVVAPGADTLRVRWPEYTSPVAVPLSEISRLELSSGRHRKVVKSAVVGTLGAGAVGAALGAVSYKPCNTTEAFGCFLAPGSRGESAMVGAAVGGVLGLVFGTLAGLPRREDWHRVSLDTRRVAIAVTPRGHGTNLGASLRF